MNLIQILSKHFLRCSAVVHFGLQVASKRIYRGRAVWRLRLITTVKRRA